MLNNKNYITVQGWMVKELGLKGNKLLTYALIYGFSQDRKSEFTGSLSYIADWVGVTKRAAIDIINDLIDKKLIEKIEHTAGNVKYSSYKITSAENFTGGEEISPGGSEKTSPQHIYIINNNNTPPIIPPKGEALKQEFKDLWNNKLAKYYSEQYPYNTPLPVITKNQLKHLSARDKELRSLIKELLADGIITEEPEDVWRWAFTQIWNRLTKSSFLQGKAKDFEDFVFDANFLLKPDKFLKIVTPTAISKYGLDDKR